jgi:hypothetical protein
MALQLKSLKRDLDKQNEGAWIPLPEFVDPDTGEVPELLVRGINYSHFQTARAGMLQRFARKYQMRPVPHEEAHEADGKLLAKFILLGWRGIAEPYSKDFAEEMLCDPASPMQDYVRRCSIEVAEIDAEYAASAEGNSSRSSDGISKAKAA